MFGWKRRAKYQTSLTGGKQEEPKDKQKELKSQSSLKDDKVSSGSAEISVKLGNKKSNSPSILSNSAKSKNEEFEFRTKLRDNRVASGGACVRDVKKNEKNQKEQCLEDKKRSKKPSKSQAGCSKNCKGVEDGDDPGSYKFTVCTSAKRNGLAYRIKRSKKKIGEISKQVKSGTKKSVKKLKNICKSIKAKRVMGYKCDLRECRSTLVECSKSCTDSNMIFPSSGKEKAQKIDGGKHHITSEQQTGTMPFELVTNKTKQNDKSIVTVEEKDTNT